MHSIGSYNQQITSMTTDERDVCRISSPNILLFGPPGSGKGTFSGHLSQHGYKHFSLGEQVGHHIKVNSASIQPLLPLVKRAYEQRVSLETLINEPGVREFVFKIMDEYIVQCKEDNKPFILDGPIRSLEDVSWLLCLLKKQQITNLAIVHLKIDTSILVERSINRRVCSQCNAIYNNLTKKPVKENFCNGCQNELIQRPDDHLDVCEKRFVYYEGIVAPAIDALIEKCSQQSVPVHTFDVNRPAEECLKAYQIFCSPIIKETSTSSQLNCRVKFFLVPSW